MTAARFTKFPRFVGSRLPGQAPILPLSSTNRQPRGNPGARKATGLTGAPPHGSRVTESKGIAMRAMRKLLGAVLGAVLLAALFALASPAPASAADSSAEAQFVAQ